MDTIDTYGPNPLADWLAQQHPDQFAAASAVAPPPRMFQGGTADVPAFTASGIEPELLLRLPYGLRHFAAAEPDITRVHSLFENYSTKPYAQLDHDGLADAWRRLQEWLEHTDPRTPEQVAADLAAEYAGFYPEATA